MFLIRTRTRQWLLLAAAALALIAVPLAGANEEAIRAHCEADRPVVTSRPKGSEHVIVVCRKGIPEFLVDPGHIEIYDPITQAMPREVPPDFGGWVTVWLNDHPLVTPYDPIRRVQEPDAYLSASTGRVMMPVRFVTEAFGGEAEWNHRQRRVILSLPAQDRTLRIWVDQPEAEVNGEQVRLDQAAVIFQDRVFVPVRFLAEGFGAAVEWDHANRSARVYLAGAGCASELYCGEVVQ